MLYIGLKHRSKTFIHELDMSEFLQSVQAMFRDNFGPAIFLVVVGTIAFIFIGYLLFDYFRTALMIFRARRHHREELRREHRHS